MGANYDTILCKGRAQSAFLRDLVNLIEDRRHFDGVEALESAAIAGDNAVLIGPPSKYGWHQVVANCAGLGYSHREWFEGNPIAAQLSCHDTVATHFWSLDSGYVAGYCIYDDHKRIESCTVFAKSAGSERELFPGVPVPAAKVGNRLQALVGDTTFEFASALRAQSTLEVGVATLIQRFGCEVQLVDYYDATDERYGISLSNNKYIAVPLVNWKVLMFH